MLGHTLCRVLAQRHGVVGTVRGHAKDYRSPLLEVPLYSYVDINNLNSVAGAIQMINPDIVINAIEMSKPTLDASNQDQTIAVNSLLPHKLAKYCQYHGAKLIHLSSDRVFAGTRGNYDETSCPDATDWYGRTKSLGDVWNDHDLTLRVSYIGHELYLPGPARYPKKTGLLDWFLRQTWAPVPGFTQAFFSGMTTTAVARTIDTIITDNPDLTGLYHVAGPKISKHDLLTLINDRFKIHATIEPAPGFVIDQSLNDDRFRAATKIEKPTWPEMIDDLYAEQFLYTAAQP
jgi:dTDP-4-dehydrorhamnose reductase